jgi:hypothetical protein
VNSVRRKDILDLVGKNMITPEYDVRAVRSRMSARDGARSRSR